MRMSMTMTPHLGIELHCKCCGGVMDPACKLPEMEILQDALARGEAVCPECGRSGVRPEEYNPAYKAALTRRKNKERQRAFLGPPRGG